MKAGSFHTPCTSILHCGEDWRDFEAHLSNAETGSYGFKLLAPVPRDGAAGAEQDTLHADSSRSAALRR
eukprot:scaffold455_cov160-Pinguiococcus_pyrenoidosus.AAC.4